MNILWVMGGGVLLLSFIAIYKLTRIQEFLAVMAGQPKSAARELDLENHAEILLIHFNNPNKAIQR